MRYRRRIDRIGHVHVVSSCKLSARIRERKSLDTPQMAQGHRTAGPLSARSLAWGNIAEEFTNHRDCQLQLSDMLIPLLGKSIYVLEPTLQHVQRMHHPKFPDWAR